MTISKEIDELLNEICFMAVPYETRAEMCAAVVRAAREDLYNVDNGGYQGTVKESRTCHISLPH